MGPFRFTSRRGRGRWGLAPAPVPSLGGERLPDLEVEAVAVGGGAVGLGGDRDGGVGAGELDRAVGVAVLAAAAGGAPDAGAVDVDRAAAFGRRGREGELAGDRREVKDGVLDRRVERDPILVT